MRQAGFIALLMIAPMCATAAVPQTRHSGESGAWADALVGGTRLVTLENGMQLLLAPDTTAAAVDVAVWFRAGIVHEHLGVTGISHLFEHLMFRGSEHYGPQEHSRLVAAEGGTANAYTAPDYACYYETIPPAALELAFRLEADRIASLKLTPAALEAEKRVVREEKRWRGQSGSAVLALQRLDRLAWRVHPYRWPITGLDEDLDRITLANCESFFEDHYAPNNALVTVVGSFDPDEVLRAAKRWLEPLKRRHVANDAPSLEPPQKAERRSFDRLDLSLPMLVVGWKIPGHRDPDTPALELLTRLLETGASSRLQRALVSGPTHCLSVQGGLDERRDSGLLYAMATLRPGSDSASVERALVEEVEKLAREPVGEEELERARRQEEIGTLLRWQTPHGRAESLGSGQMLDGDYRASALRFERLRQLTPADLQRAAARHLVAAGRNVVWLAPVNAPSGPGPEPGGPGGTGSGSTKPPAKGGR